MCDTTEAACMDVLSIATPHRCCSPCIVQRMHGSLFLSICTTARDCNLFPPLSGEESTDSLQNGVSTRRNRQIAMGPRP